MIYGKATITFECTKEEFEKEKKDLKKDGETWIFEKISDLK